MSLNVLIVDDSSIVRSVIQMTLGMISTPVEGCTQAGNGKEALDALAKQPFDVCFVDINMPVMNGVELITAMKADPKLEKIPVIVISTEGSATRMDQLKGMGVAGYIRKPFTPEQFQEVVDQVLGTKDNV